MDGSISIYKLSNSQLFVFVSRIPFFCFWNYKNPTCLFLQKRPFSKQNKKEKNKRKKNSTSIFVWGKIRWTGQEKQTASENKRKKTKLPFLFGEQPGATSICLGIIKWKQRKHLHFCLGESPGEVLSSWSKLDFPSLAFELLKLFVQDELSSDELWDPRRLVWWPWTHDGSVELIDIHIYIYIYTIMIIIIIIIYISRWWFQRFFISTPKIGKWSNLTSIFFKWVGSTTN